MQNKYALFIDHSAMVEASMSNACLGWKMDQSSRTERIKKGEVLTAMATIMYSKNKLQQVGNLV